MAKRRFADGGAAATPDLDALAKKGYSPTTVPFRPPQITSEQMFGPESDITQGGRKIGEAYRTEEDPVRFLDNPFGTPNQRGSVLAEMMNTFADRVEQAYQKGVAHAATNAQRRARGGSIGEERSPDMRLRGGVRKFQNGGVNDLASALQARGASPSSQLTGQAAVNAAAQRAGVSPQQMQNFFSQQMGNVTGAASGPGPGGGSGVAQGLQGMFGGAPPAAGATPAAAPGAFTAAGPGAGVGAPPPMNPAAMQQAMMARRGAVGGPLAGGAAPSAPGGFMGGVAPGGGGLPTAGPRPGGGIPMAPGGPAGIGPMTGGPGALAAMQGQIPNAPAGPRPTGVSGTGGVGPMGGGAPMPPGGGGMMGGLPANAPSLQQAAQQQGAAMMQSPAMQAQLAARNAYQVPTGGPQTTLTPQQLQQSAQSFLANPLGFAKGGLKEAGIDEDKQLGNKSDKYAKGGKTRKFNSAAAAAENLPTHPGAKKLAKGGVLRRKPKAAPAPTPAPYSDAPPPPTGAPPMLAKGGKWIGKAIKKPGALHKDLGVPQGEKIPTKKLAKAAQAGGKLGQRARLAETLRGMKKNKGGACDKMAAGGAAKQRRGYPSTTPPPKKFAEGGKIRGCGVASKGCTFSGIY